MLHIVQYFSIWIFGGGVFSYKAWHTGGGINHYYRSAMFPGQKHALSMSISSIIMTELIALIQDEVLVNKNCQRHNGPRVLSVQLESDFGVKSI